MVSTPRVGRRSVGQRIPLSEIVCAIIILKHHLRRIVVELTSGAMDRILEDFPIVDFDVSSDSQIIAFTADEPFPAIQTRITAVLPAHAVRQDHLAPELLPTPLQRRR